jgi:putative cell wall-binding protein
MAGLVGVAGIAAGFVTAVPTPAAASVGVQTTTSVACNEAGQVELTAHLQNVGTEPVAVTFRPQESIGFARLNPSETFLDPAGTDQLTLFTGKGQVGAGAIVVDAWPGDAPGERPAGPAPFSEVVAYPALACGGVDFTGLWAPSQGPAGTELSVSGQGCPPTPTLPATGVQFGIVIGDIETGAGLLDIVPAADGTWSATYTVPAELDATGDARYPVMAYCISTGVHLQRPDGFTYQRPGEGPSLPPVPVVRLAGENRYETAAAVSAATFPSGVSLVFVATGEAFPDALAGTPAAIRAGAPLLLTRPEELPAATAAELQRLAPVRIIVLGGEGAVGPGVLAALEPLASGSVERLSGPDRFTTAVAIADRFTSEVPVAYVATGDGFADAVSGGPAAGSSGGPLLLTQSDALPAATRDALVRLAPPRIVVLGGPGAVADAVVSELAGLAPTVVRAGGENRFATSAAVARDAFDPPTGRVYLATGASFPDALAGGVAAGLTPAPVLLVQQSCIPTEVAEAILALSARAVVILGGEGAVGSGVASLQVCPPTAPG